MLCTHSCCVSGMIHSFVCHFQCVYIYFYAKSIIFPWTRPTNKKSSCAFAPYSKADDHHWTVQQQSVTQKNAEAKWKSERKQMTQYNSTLCLWARSHKCHYFFFLSALALIFLSGMMCSHVHDTFTRSILRARRTVTKVQTWRLTKKEKKKKEPMAENYGTCMKNEQILYKHWNKMYNSSAMGRI